MTQDAQRIPTPLWLVAVVLAGLLGYWLAGGFDAAPRADCLLGLGDKIEADEAGATSTTLLSGDVDDYSDEELHDLFHAFCTPMG